jgi:phosphomethylpyrimidine synthase
MTQLEYAKQGISSPIIKRVARLEGSSIPTILRRISAGRVVIPLNKNRSIKKVCGIGYGLRTKVNANIGTSTDRHSISEELKKLQIAVDFGADTVMDLSIGGEIKKMRREILRHSPVPVGTVPIYEIAVGAHKQRGDFLKFDIGEILTTLQAQAEDGVDFFTIHAGVTQASLSLLKSNKRLLGIVSRGGAILARWISCHRKENPFFQHFDKILDLAYNYDVTLSLGDGLRPGSIWDATDRAQIAELKILADLAHRARKKCVQVMIEGPGHVPLNQIKKNVFLQKKICRNAPFYVLGPLVTDIASGHDHIAASIGAALAGSFGADFLCYVTPSEHLRHPSIQDVKEGVIASKIAAHAADLAKGIKSAREWDKQISQARKNRDWKRQIALSVDPVKAAKYRLSSKQPRLRDVCTMCGRYCSIKLMQECMG